MESDIKQTQAEDIFARVVQVREQKNMRATELEMKKALGGKVEVGKTLVIKEYSRNNTHRLKLVSRRKGKIVETHPHIFLVNTGNFIESFRYSQFFTKDLTQLYVEEGKVCR